MDKMNKKNVAIYLRVCCPSSNSVFSAEILREKYKRMISEHPSWYYMGTYEDHGTSSTALESMIQECQSKSIDLVITKNISRISRNITEAMNTIKILEKYGVGIYFLDEHICTTDKDFKEYHAFLNNLV